MCRRRVQSIVLVWQCITFQRLHGIAKVPTASRLLTTLLLIWMLLAMLVSVKKFKWLRKAHGFMLACNFSCLPVTLSACSHSAPHSFVAPPLYTMDFSHPCSSPHEVCITFIVGFVGKYNFFTVFIILFYSIFDNHFCR